MSFKIFLFDDKVKSQDIIEEMKKETYNPGNFRELLTLDRENPELKKRFVVVALGSKWIYRDGLVCVPAIRLNSNGLGSRCLYPFDRVWSKRYCFLGTKKIEPLAL